MPSTFFLVSLALAGIPDGSQPVRSNGPAELPADRAAMPPAEPLSRTAPGLFRANENIRTLAPIDAVAIANADAEASACADCPGGKRVRTGLVRSLPLPMTQFETVVTPLNREQSMWTFAVRSPGSIRTRLRLLDLDLRGGSMIVWGEGPNGAVVRGTYRGQGPDDDGELWTASVPGDTVYVEIVGREVPIFTVAEVIHQDRDEAAQAGGGNGEQDGGTNGNGVFSCHNDAMCFSSSYDIPRRATGQMNFVSGGGSYVCSGTLLNDNDGETFAPYFLTAYHCMHTETEANSLEVVWLWQKDACNGVLPDYDALPRSTGADMLVSQSTDDSNDMSFMRLDGLLPGGLAFAGWTTGHPSDSVGFHHPSGSWKRATDFEAVGLCLYCVCKDSSDYDYYKMVDGLVEGGSSGSGMFNSSGQLSGQLLGRCGTSSPDNMNCSNIDDYAAMYGEFEESYEAVNFWLEELGGTIWANAAQPQFPTQNGSQSFPFDTVAEAYAESFDGAQIKMIAGSYPGTITMTKILTVKAINGTVTIGQ